MIDHRLINNLIKCKWSKYLQQKKVFCLGVETQVCKLRQRHGSIISLNYG